MKITERGLRYIEWAMDNLYAREDKLKNAWCSDHEFIGVVTTERQRRLMRIANELNKRWRELASFRVNSLEKLREDQIKSDYEHLTIQCHIMFCTSPIGRGLYRKDYVPGEHKCTGCGHELMTYEEWQVARQIRYQKF